MSGAAQNNGRRNKRPAAGESSRTSRGPRASVATTDGSTSRSGSESSAPASDCVALHGDRLEIRTLTVEGSAVTAARAAVESGHSLEAVVGQMLEVGGTILLHGAGKATVDAMAAEVDRLLTALAERSARIEALRRAQERVSAKGFGYEDMLAPVLDECFRGHNDAVERTSGVRGIADDLCGDFLVTINPRDTGGRDRKIVFEAKDRPLSLNKAMAEMDDAMINRDAQVAVLVFASAAQAPIAGKPLRVLHGQRIIAVWDKEGQESLAIEVAAQLGRSLAIAAEREDLGLDRRMLAEKLAGLINVVERASEIRRGLRSARRGIDAAERGYEHMRENAMAILYELEDRLGSDSE